MKTKKLLILTATFFVAMLHAIAVQAQQSRAAITRVPTQQDGIAGNMASYSYRLYNAPGNGYGYDIYKDGKPVYHQFVLMFITKDGKRLFASKQQAESATLLAIERVKKGQSPALSTEELKKIVTP